MSSETDVEVSASAINVTILEGPAVDAPRRGETFILTTLNVQLLPVGHLAAKAYGRPALGGRGTYTSFAVPDRPRVCGPDRRRSRQGRLSMDGSPRSSPPSLSRV